MLRSITTITCVGVIAIVFLQIFDRHDGSIQAITIIIGFLTPTIVGLMSLMKSQENSIAIKDMHSATDNTLSRISSNAKVAADNAKTASDKAELAAVKAYESAAKIEMAVQNGHTVIEQTTRIAEIATQTAQNVEAIKKNGH